MGLLGRFVGMLTDSRSFLSYSRHEYFRRLLCNLLGNDVERGLLPDDRGLLGNLVRDVCFGNVRDYFEFQRGLLLTRRGIDVARQRGALPRSLRQCPGGLPRGQRRRPAGAREPDRARRCSATSADEMVGRFAWEFVVENDLAPGVRGQDCRNAAARAFRAHVSQKGRLRAAGDARGAPDPRRARQRSAASAPRSSTSPRESRPSRRCARAKSATGSWSSFRRTPSWCTARALVFVNSAAVRCSAPKSLRICWAGARSISSTRIRASWCASRAERSARSACALLAGRADDRCGSMARSWTSRSRRCRSCFRTSPAIQVVIRDITLRKLAEEQIRSLAYHDPLTGFRIASCSATGWRWPSPRPPAEAQGRRAVHRSRPLQGDQRLARPRDRRQAAASGRHSASNPACARAIRVSRLGGDEFTLVLARVWRMQPMPPVPPKKCSRRLRPPFRIEGRELLISASVGISLYPTTASRSKRCSATRTLRCTGPRSKAATAISSTRRTCTAVIPIGSTRRSCLRCRASDRPSYV